MNLERLIAELDLAVQDSSLKPYFTDWLNDAILEIASDFELPDLKLKAPTTLTVTTDGWLYDMPATYHKKVFKCRNSTGVPISVRTKIEDIEVIDYGHADTGDNVQLVAVEGNQIAVYPKANDTLSLWYYRLPVPMEADEAIPDGIPEAYHERVIIPKVLLKNYRLLTDMTMQQPHQSIQYWEAKYREGLYGSQSGDVGMINYLAKMNPPKVSTGCGRYKGRFI